MKIVATFVALVALLGSGMSAQTPAGPLTPSEPHERLSFFEGTWTYDEAAPASNFRETCAWLPSGRRHMVCVSRSQAATGPREGYSIFSYRPADRTYVYQGFRPNGAVQSLEGRVSDDGKTWEFWGEEGSGAMRTRTRVKIVPLEKGGFRFSEQTAVGYADWSPEFVVHYRLVRQRQASVR